MPVPFYDPEKSYYENFELGPFGIFAGSAVIPDSGQPRFEFLGHRVNLPFGIPAGPLINGRFVKAALDKGFDLPVYKTVRTHKYPCHPWPNVLPVKVDGNLTPEIAGNGLATKKNYDAPLSITNSFGVPSYDPDFWQNDMSSAAVYAKKGQVVIGSFQGTTSGDGNVGSYISDFVTAARLVKETGVKILEVNLSCPNEGTAHLLCFDRERSQKVIEAIKNEIGNTPLIIKIAYFEDQAKLEDLLKSVGSLVQGVSAINTIAAEIRDEQGNQALPGEGRLKSGVCGYGIKWAGLEMVKALKDFREDLHLKFAIIGVGGVMAVSDYNDYKTAGADAVMSATGAMWNPKLAQEIKESYINL